MSPRVQALSIPLTLSKTSWETQEFSGILHARCVDRLVRVGYVPPSDLPRISKIILDRVVDPIGGLDETWQVEASLIADPVLARRISCPTVVKTHLISIHAGLKVSETVHVCVCVWLWVVQVGNGPVSDE